MDLQIQRLSRGTLTDLPHAVAEKQHHAVLLVMDFPDAGDVLEVIFSEHAALSSKNEYNNC
jgi:hypothetical protein